MTRRSLLIAFGAAAIVIASTVVFLVDRDRAPAEESGWSRVALDSSQFADGASMIALTAGGPGWVAVGGTGEAHAAAWSSLNGSDWVRVPHDDDVFGGSGFHTMSAVSAGGPGLVAVGNEGSDTGIAAAVWTSVEGLAWSRVPGDPTIFGGPHDDALRQMFDVVEGGPGLVAVGDDISDTAWGVAVWTSTDGLVWNLVPHNEDVFAGPNLLHMRSAAVGGPGLVVVGEEEEIGWVVWTSADGLTWTKGPRGDSTPGGPYEYMNSVVAGGPGLVAVGADWSDQDVAATFGEGVVAAVWTSTDGLRWTRVPLDRSVFSGQVMNDVAAGGPGLVAVGMDYSRNLLDSSGGSIADVAVWTSIDGLAWNRAGPNQAVFGTGQMTAAAAAGPIALALGYEDEASLPSAMWMMSPQEAAEPSTSP